MKTAFLSLLLAISAYADGTPAAGGCADAQRGAPVTTQHQISVDGKVLNYSATVGYLDITVTPALYASAFPAATATAPAKACVFYTAYQVAPTDPAHQRPITFAFNGGPGSASLWLHLGR